MPVKNNSRDKKSKRLLVFAILLLTLVFFLLLFFYNNYLVEKKIDIYFANNTAEYLVVEKKVIDPEADLYFQIFAKLKAGPESDKLSKTIPNGSKLLDYSIKRDKLILNFNAAFRSNHWGGSTGELMTVYSIVNSYTSLTEIESVKILIEGEGIVSLAGHLDLTEPLIYNQRLIDKS